MQIDYSASWLFFELHVWDKSSWIKVQKLPAVNKGRGTGISIPTHTSPKKVQQLPRSLYEKLKNTEVLARNKGRGIEKVQQVPMPLDETLKSTEVPAGK